MVVVEVVPVSERATTMCALPTLFSWYLHGTFMVPSWYLHGTFLMAQSACDAQPTCEAQPTCDAPFV